MKHEMNLRGSVYVEADEGASPELKRELAKSEIAEGRIDVDGVCGIHHFGRVVFDRGTDKRFRDLVVKTLNESAFIDAQIEGDTVVINGYNPEGELS